jgi:hypothetical protein
VPVEEALARAESRYPEEGSGLLWRGVVLAAQGPGASVHHVSPSRSAKEYWHFVEAAVRAHQSRLLIKMHPKAGGSIRERHEALAASCGSEVGFYPSSIVDHCEYVLTFNSTFAVEALGRGVPVAQYAPGALSDTGAVTYTHWRLPRQPPQLKKAARALLGFLLFRYCFPVPPWDVVRQVIALYRERTSLFPISEELSYGHWLLQQQSETS